MANPLTIGQLAAATGVAARTIRYYEQIGVLPAPARAASGYRQYGERDVRRLLFVRRARALQLPLRQVQALGVTIDDGAVGTTRPRLAALVRAHLGAVRRRIAELESLERELARVLRRRPAPPRHGAGCRCLDAPNGAGAARRRAARESGRRG